MLLRTCTILLLLSLLSAAASVADRTTSVGATEKPPLARAVGGSPGQKRRAANRRPPGKAQGQGQGPGTQQRQPARRPARQRPSRRPQRRPAQQTPGNAQDVNGNQRAEVAYMVCYLYPAEYQDIRPSQPYIPTSNGVMYPPYISYKISKPASARNRATGGPVNKIFGPQPWYPGPLYPSRLVCPLYQPLSAAATVPPQQVLEYVNSDLDNMLTTDNPDIPAADVGPGMFYLPGDGELPLPYNSIYEPSGLEPDLTYPSGGYVTPQPFGYPPPYGF